MSISYFPIRCSISLFLDHYFCEGTRQELNEMNFFFNPCLKRWLFLLHYDKNSLSPRAEIWLKVTKVAEGDMRPDSCKYIMPRNVTFHQSLYLFAFRFHQDTAWTISPQSSSFNCSWFYFSSDLQVLVWSKLPSSHSLLVSLDSSKYFFCALYLQGDEIFWWHFQRNPAWRAMCGMEKVQINIQGQTNTGSYDEKYRAALRQAEQL